jgi:hypothetical protein
VADSAADEYPAAVGLDNVFHDAQTDSHTLGLPPQLRAGAVEALENLFVLRGWDAVAMVLDPEEEACCVLRVACCWILDAGF